MAEYITNLRTSRHYDSVRREVLYNILDEFGIAMKQVRITKSI
jgi:hypothetical protein